MDKNTPFVYGTTVSTFSFTNREADCEKLKTNLLQGINTMIISPRRWGKSSLVEKVVNDINRSEKVYKTIVLDLFSVNDEHEFLELYAKAVLKASSKKWQEWVTNTKEFIKALSPKISLGIDPVNDFEIGFDWDELKKNSSEILALPEKIAQEKNLHFIICLDEFQQISNFKSFISLEKKLRASWQRQKRVTYCLYGSKRHMMQDIFNKPSKPFYKFGDILLLQKIQRERWIDFIQKGFRSTGKSIGEKEAGIIADCMKNHSWYVQQLAHYAWNKTENQCTEKIIASALEELIQANSPLFQREAEFLSKTQRNLLKAITKKATQFTGVKTMNDFNLGTPNNVRKNIAILAKNDIIDYTNKHMEVLDPVFEIWFKRVFG